VGNIKRILVVQRISLSHDELMSRSIGARFYPLLRYLCGIKLVEWDQITEDHVSISDLKRFDVVLFNKHTSKHAIRIMQMAHELGLKTIYDLDDWILDLPQYSVTELTGDDLENIVWLVRNASAVTVSNANLFEKISKIRTPIFILKNGIDWRAFEGLRRARKESANPRILFSNTDGIKLVRYKYQFFEILSSFLNANPDVSIDFWGDIFPEVLKLPRINLRGFLDNQVYKEALADEGYWFAIVPLGGQEDADTIFFNSCKSCIKYIDYGALGIPGIYSNSPVYSAVVKNNTNGILVDNDPHSWEVALNNLLLDSSLRQKISDGAYLDVVRNHGIEGPANTFLKLISIELR
jgi:glycosyltransferase involved in cell wall biosynthesis